MRAVSAYRYMTITGTANRWFYLLFMIFALWLGYSRTVAGKTIFAHYFFLFAFPVAAGSGLLSAARRGEFDLLFGAGETRSSVWRVAFYRAWLIPAGMVVLIFSISGSPNVSSLLTRLPAVLFLTGGVAFAVGLVDVRYLVGVVWLLSRLLVVVTPAALHAISTLSKGGEMPSHLTLAIMVVTAPETLLEPRMPPEFLIGSAFIGVAALASSYVWFERADLGGRRL